MAKVKVALTFSDPEVLRDLEHACRAYSFRLGSPEARALAERAKAARLRLENKS